MDIYHYDPVNGEYKGTGQADECPLKKGDWIIPAFATTTAPPEIADHQAAVFSNGAWRIVPDYRGTTWWHQDGTGYTITWLGVAPAPEDSDTPPPPTLEEIRTAKLASLAAYRWQRETAGITVGGVVIKTDRESQSLLNGALKLFDLDPVLGGIDWKGENRWVLVNKATLEAVGLAVGAHVQACFTREKVHAEAIEALTTAEAIEAYDFTTGWPV